MTVYSLNKQEKEFKERLHYTSLKTLSIKRENLYKLYPPIGYGDEGSAIF